MTYDIDMFPCNRTLFDLLEPLPSNGLVTRTDLRTLVMSRRFGAGSVIADKSIFQKILNTNGIDIPSSGFWNTTIRQQCLAIKKDIHLNCAEADVERDELFFFQCTVNALHKIPSVTSIHYPRNQLFTNRTVDRTTNKLSYPITPLRPEVIESFRHGLIAEAHVCRDIEKNVTAMITKLVCGEE